MTTNNPFGLNSALPGLVEVMQNNIDDQKKRIKEAEELILKLERLKNTLEYFEVSTPFTIVSVDKGYFDVGRVHVYCGSPPADADPDKENQTFSLIYIWDPVREEWEHYSMKDEHYEDSDS